MTEAVLRIGEVAQRLGISTRTLRYYEEIGLVTPSDHSPGGSRRYTEADVARVEHIRELQQVLGFDLDSIRKTMQAEDRLEQLRSEYRKGVSPKRLQSILVECMTINADAQELVARKIGLLAGTMAELKAKTVRYHEVAAEHGIDLPHPSEPAVKARRS
jgi:DNA-binding transcriptional MerR regulator